jgi:hypothetical protein
VLLHGLLLAGLLALGCSDDASRAPVAECTGSHCATPPIQGVGANTGEGGEPGVGGDGGAGGDGVITVSVTRFESDDFTTLGAFSEPAQILADGEGGATVEAHWDGLQPLALEGLAEEPFFLVSPAQLGSDALPTLLRPRLDGAVSLPLVRASVVDGLVALSSLPLELDAQRAVLILALVDAASLAPIQGAVLTEPSADTVLYGASGSWSDTVTETDSSGTAAFVNLQAAEWPGKLTSVAVSGSVSGAIALRSVAGAVTVLRLAIER